MKTAIRRIAVAVAAAALAVPALAADPKTCPSQTDATWPEARDCAPALILEGPGRSGPVDTTQEPVAGVSPAMAVTEHRAEGAVADYSSPAPEHHAAVLMGVRPAHVAAR
jgi:hypothetical protein